MAEFRITAWPGPLEPLESVVAPAELRIDGDRIVAGADTPLRVYQVPEELYLRELRDLDLEDAEAVGGFLEQFGWLGVGDYGWPPADHPVPYPPELMALVRETLEEGARRSGRRETEHLEEFRHCVRWVRDLTGIYLDHSRGELVDGPTRWEGSMDRPRGEEMALLALQVSLDRALGWARAHVRVEGGAGSGRRGRPDNLLTALVIQLFNHVAERAKPRICASETHEGMFVRQRREGGRSGSARTRGVKYCTRACARAEAQRAYRRRSSSG